MGIRATATEKKEGEEELNTSKRITAIQPPQLLAFYYYYHSFDRTTRASTLHTTLDQEAPTTIFLDERTFKLTAQS